jgi:hypothetical protein
VWPQLVGAVGSFDDLSELSMASTGDQAALDGFIDRRLLTVDGDLVEIIHEVLLSAWPRLREWIEADRSGCVFICSSPRPR